MQSAGTGDSTRPAAADPLTFVYHHRTRARDGQSVHIDELVSALRRQGHAVHIVGPTRRDAMAGDRLAITMPAFIHELLELGYSIIEFIKLQRAIRRFRPDAIYERANIFMLSGVWAARFNRLPLLLEVNSPLALERASHGRLSLRKLASWTERVSWRAAYRVLTVTRVIADHVMQSDVPLERIGVVPNGVNLADFPQPGVRRPSGAAGEIVLGFVGFAREWHGLDRIIDLMAESAALRHTRLLLVGDGPACPELRRRARANGIENRLTITGVVPRERVRAALADVDIALQPDVTAYASPLKLFEYMAAGCAVVAPDLPNLREVLEDGVDALLFEPGNAAALGAQIERLTESAELRYRLGLAARARIESRPYTWDENARTVAALVTKRRSPRGA